MEILIHVLYVIIGLIGLYYGAEWLVKGAAALALQAGISSLVVGLTVVAFGTSTPELLVSIQDNLSGGGDLLLGNVIGSNICNIGLVLGVAAVMTPFCLHRQFVRRELPLLVFVSVVFVLLLLHDKQIGRIEGLIFTLGIVSYTIYCIRAARADPDDPLATVDSELELDEVEEKSALRSAAVLRNVALAIGGLIVLAVGASLLVSGGKFLAKTMGVSELVIGLTVIAIGTSLPELATTVVACLKNEAELAVGNAIGSCLFNLLCVVGVTASIRPIVSTNIEYVDLAVMVAFAAATWLMMQKDRTLGRPGGAMLLVGYVGYTGYIIWKSMSA